MQYRDFGKTGIKVSSLGFGCMRFPVIGGDEKAINEAESKVMLETAIDNGVNYIDTAYPYHGGNSEVFVGRALKGGLRNKVYLATKLPSWKVNDEGDFTKYLDEQLEKLQTDHIDMYLMHALDKGRWENLKKHNIFDALDNYKKSGKVRFIGFSFHDNFNVFNDIINSYPWDFCQIQFNYLDSERQAGLKGLKMAGEKGMGLVIMEPLLGGKLANNVPPSVYKLWESSGVKRTPAEWALRYVMDFNEVSCVLSGMSSLDQVKENLRISSLAAPKTLSNTEHQLISKVRDEYSKLLKVQCTGCGYCMPCPNKVWIPENFLMYNEAYMFNQLEKNIDAYRRFKPEWKASNCIECGKCESVCPQKLPIRNILKEVDKALNK